MNRVDPEIARLKAIIAEQNKALRKVITERDAAWDELDGKDGERDALALLRQTYNDPAKADRLRIDAARAALPFERSKPPSYAVHVGPSLLGQRLAEARGMKVVEAESAEVVALPAKAANGT